MVPLELRRSDIGFGRVIVDDAGVMRRTLRTSHMLAWDEIRDYRITIEMRGAKLEVLYLVDWLNSVLIARDIYRGYQGRHRYRLGIELHGEGRRLQFNWRFRAVDLAIARIVDRIGPRLVAARRAELARNGIARFGPIALADHGIGWADRPPLAREAVEAVELFNSSPVRLRVMARDRAWPYGQAKTAAIPDLLGALAIAAELGYEVRGRELLTFVG